MTWQRQSLAALALCSFACDASGGPLGPIGEHTDFVDAAAAATSADGEFDTETMCTSDSYWTRGNRESPLMHPGAACIACHETGALVDDELERGPRFSLAGTVFPSAHEPDDCNGVDGRAEDVSIEVTDANGSTFRMRANQVGNFYREDRDVVFPIHAKVIYQGRTRAMISAVETGDCNSCHTESGDMAAPGRILLP